ncbi:hypothetical protein PVK06_035788 [Gossypium arboreum]|uniref:Bet v I/Major latex protein domain-containing protein n=1 Tax=Gossypium arboreum TaxID=29729 RepID=A0ABR0NJV7_GOSAR|nr:hypothetical protein PVK06_035788 [Gossypium arboreum]
MGVVTYEFEVTSPVAPTRLFKAFVLEGAKVYPKAAPHAIKSVELEGDGKPGSIVKINFVEGLPFVEADLHAVGMKQVQLEGGHASS